MKAATKTTLVATLGLACVACCTTPVLGLLSGLLGISALPLLATGDLLYIAVLALPLLIGAVLYYLHRRRRNRCASAEAPCQGGGCGTR